MNTNVIPIVFPAADLPQSVPLSVGVRPEDGEIIDIGPFRHKVRWIDNGTSHDSSVTYCNNCGSTLMRNGTIKTDKGLLKAMICAECGEFMGLCLLNKVKS